MEEKFKVFYEPSEENLSGIWSNSKTIFILDTNILLNFYRYSQETQDEFFRILNIIGKKIWIPFHVALEYQRRRLEVIRDEKDIFDRIEGKLKTIKTSVNNNLSEFKLKDRNPDLFDMEKKFKEEVCLLIDSFTAEVNKTGKAQPSVRTHDEIRAKLDALLEGRVGDEPEEKWVIEVAEDGARRYENEVPPGYKDESKGHEGSKAVFTYNNIEYERKYGDLIIWKQILEHLKKLEGIENVIFITDDIKEDWWEIVKCNGSKHIGARTELKSEMYRETGVNSFKMYHTNDFLVAAEKYCNTIVDDKAIKETENLFKSSKSRVSLEEELSNLYDKYSLARRKEASLKYRLNKIQHDDENFSNKSLYDIQTIHDEISNEKDSLAEQLYKLQTLHDEISNEKDSLAEQLFNIEMSDKSLYDIQTRYDEANSELLSLDDRLSDLNNKYSLVRRKEASLKQRLDNMQQHSKEFSDENLYKIQKRLNDANSERALLEEQLSNLQKSYDDIIRRKH